MATVALRREPPATLVANVGRAEILRGEAGSVGSCPVAWALDRYVDPGVFPFARGPQVFAATTLIYIGNGLHLYEHTHGLARLIAAIDAGELFRPQVVVARHSPRCAACRPDPEWAI